MCGHRNLVRVFAAQPVIRQQRGGSLRQQAPQNRDDVLNTGRGHYADAGIWRHLGFNLIGELTSSEEKLFTRQNLDPV